MTYNTLQSRLEHTLSLEVEEFTLKLTYHDKEFVLPRVVKWITLIFDWEKCEGTESLLINKAFAFYWWTYIVGEQIYYSLPQVVLKAKVVSELWLAHCKLEPCNQLSLFI